MLIFLFAIYGLVGVGAFVTFRKERPNKPKFETFITALLWPVGVGAKLVPRNKDEDS